MRLPDAGRILIMNPPVDATLAALDPNRLAVVADLKPQVEVWRGRGVAVTTQAEGQHAAAIVCLPRAKPLARAMVAEAMAKAGEIVVIDGQKTDGVESLLREIRARAGVCGQVAKAHGKMFWLRPAPDIFTDWAQGPSRTAGGFWTAPGVFSADGVDPASELLAELLPRSLGGHVADFGAGWGFLAAHALTREGVQTVDLVEAGYMALECARRNVTDPRARFHWADALSWQSVQPLDTIIMNPPFHIGRAADPSLGQAFIAAAARALGPRGDLWMVANRHLPYETTFETRFAKVSLAGSDQRFKVIHGHRPKRATG